MSLSFEKARNSPNGGFIAWSLPKMVWSVRKFVKSYPQSTAQYQMLISHSFHSAVARCACLRILTTQRHSKIGLNHRCSFDEAKSSDQRGQPQMTKAYKGTKEFSTVMKNDGTTLNTYLFYVIGPNLQKMNKNEVLFYK